MLYAFFGDDVVTVRSKASDFLRKKETGAEVARISGSDYVSGSIEDSAGAQSLFGVTQIVVLDTPSASTEMFERVFDNLDMLAASETVFILIEGKLLTPEKKKLQKYTKEIFEFSKTPEDSFNTFALADALAERDKRKLWLLFSEAKARGLSAEELIGLLFWQLKVLRLAAKAKSAEESGLKPFVFNKAKRALIKFTEAEVDTLSETLTVLYHDGHAGKRDIDVALERWVLAL
jgi:DNA polymerase III delta subunit